jgi:hypothetical protein
MAKPSIDYNILEELPERFWDKVNKTDDCWLWTGKIDDGYGRFSYKGILYLVHRLVVATLKEPVVDGMVIDHICRVRNCCNPDHLRQVTISENTKKLKKQEDPTTCVNGHPLFGESAQVHISERRTRHSGDTTSITCKVCNSVRRLENVLESVRLDELV